MMRSTSGALVVAVAALLVCCSADPHQDQEDERYNSGGHKSGGLESSGNLVRQIRQFDYGRSQNADHKSRTVESLGGGNFLRENRAGPVPPYFIKQFDYGGPYGGKREWSQFSGFYGEGVPKRNFDEIDRTSFNRFLKKRNFDEIDQTLMPFPFRNKRFFHSLPVDNYDYFDTHHMSNLDKKRYSPDFPMDEIDLSHFPIGHKRSSMFR